MDIIIFDSDQTRIEKLRGILEDKYNIVIYRSCDECIKSLETNVVALFVPHEMDMHLRNRLFDRALKNDIKIFAWLPLGEKPPKFVVDLPIHFLPTPFDVEDIEERIRKALDTPRKTHIVLATAEEDFVSFAEPLFRLQGWDVTRVADSVSLRKVLDSSGVSLVWADIRLAERLLSERFEMSPRIPLIVYLPGNNPLAGTYIIDDSITIQISEVSKKALVDIVENACLRGERAALREAGFFIALDEAEKNSLLAQRLLEVQIKSARDTAIDKCKEELNLLDARTMGLVRELFALLRDSIDGLQILSKTANAKSISGDIFDIERKIAEAREILDSLSSVDWLKDSGAMERLELKKIISKSMSRVKANRRRESVKWSAKLKCLGNTIGKKAEFLEVFMNLFTNAYEAIENEGSIETRCVADNNWNIIEISDNGIGMDGEILSKAFKPYFTMKSAAHSGLGLTIAKGIIEYHGGSIEIKSKKNQGTKVIVKLPKIASTIPGTKPKKPDLLIVAYKKTLGLLQMSLARYGIDIETAESMGEAAQKIKKNTPKAILAFSSAGHIDVESVRTLSNLKKKSKLILLDPSQIVPSDIKGPDAIIRGGMPLHHLFAIIKSLLD